MPTKEDFVALDIALEGTGENRFGVDVDWITATYLTTWGGTLGGYAGGGIGTEALYWAVSESSSVFGHNLTITMNGYVFPQNSNFKSSGYQVRCVR
jgi:hypothetical protein